MTRPPHPPRLAQRLIDLFEATGAARGDLDEEFVRHVVPHRGLRRARLWYWRQAIASIPRLVGRRRAHGWLSRRRLDLGFAWRAVVRRPGPSLLAIATFALAMGANTAVFSIVHGVLLRPLPFAHESLLTRINPDELFYTSLARARRFAVHATAFDHVAPWGRTLVTFTGGTVAEEARGAAVEWHHFEMLGARPMLGRTFVAADAVSPAQVVVLSHALWMRRSGGDPSMVGRRVEVSGRTVTVIGVMGPEHVPMEPDWLVWIPLPADADGYDNALAMNARLRPGASIARGEASARAAFAALAREDGADLSAEDLAAVRVIPLRDHLVGDTRRPLLVLLGAVIVIVVLACVNVMNLRLAQGAAREQESAVRRAMGAGRGRLAMQLLLEVVVLAAAGTAAGWALAWGILQWALARLPAELPRLATIALDGQVFAYAGLSMLVAALLAGVPPAVRVTGRSLRHTLAGASRSVSPETGGLSAGLVAVEVALAVVLVVGAGLMTRSLLALRAVDPGFDTRQTVAVRVTPPSGRYESPTALDDLYAAIRAESTRSPAIVEAGSIMFLPMTPGGAWSAYRTERDAPRPPEDLPSTAFRIVTPGYFDAMGVRLLRGRAVTTADRANTEAVAVINATLARAAFGDDDPVGRILLVGRVDPQRLRVVGVVADVRQSALQTDSHPEAYLPQSQTGFARMYVVARATHDRSAALGALQAAVRAVAPDLLISRALAVDDVLAGSEAETRLLAETLGGFVIAAVMLGAIGVYGVTAQAVSRRRREIGIRMALGADRATVAIETMRRGLLPVAVGVAAGLALAALGSGVIRSLLFGVSTTDPVSYLAAPILLASAALLALAVPASRASRVDPAHCLREG